MKILLEIQLTRMRLFHQIIFVALLALACFTISVGQQKAAPVKQSQDVVQAYRVCQQFQKILSQNLDFNAAFEATFTVNKKRQRAIAMQDGEFGDIDFANIQDETLI